MTARKSIPFQELEQIFSLMSKHNVTQLTYNGMQITMPKPSPLLTEAPKEEHPVFKEPQSDLDILYAGMRKGSF